MLRVFNYNTLEKVIIQSEKKTEYRAKHDCMLIHVPYLPADRPHFFPGKMGPKLGLRLIRGYKRFDTSLICTRTHGSTVNWRFNVRFKLFLTYNTYN